MRLFLHHLKRFLADSRASMTAEFIIMLPLIIWVYAGMYVFWDAYKAQNISVKAAYTISDLISRAESDVTAVQFLRMHQMVSFLNYDKHPVRLRISFVEMDEDAAGNPDLQLDGSEAFGPLPVAPFDALQEEPFIGHSDIATIESQIPIMAINDRAIVVETELDYMPLFSFQLSPFDPIILTTFVVTRPRVGDRIGFADSGGGPAAIAPGG